MLRRDGGYMMAILPASRHLHLSALKMQLGHKVDLASEEEVAKLFDDCERGAIPPVGECYGLDVIIDSSIDTSARSTWKAATTPRSSIWTASSSPD